MLSSYDNRKVSQSIMSRGLWGLTVWWTAQVALQQPADRDDTDRAGSHDQDDIDVSSPRPSPTTINEMKAPHVGAPIGYFYRESAE